jgi:hypothetical protein
VVGLSGGTGSDAVVAATADVTDATRYCWNGFLYRPSGTVNVVHLTRHSFVRISPTLIYIVIKTSQPHIPCLSVYSMK